MSDSDRSDGEASSEAAGGASRDIQDLSLFDDTGRIIISKSYNTTELNVSEVSKLLSHALNMSPTSPAIHAICMNLHTIVSCCAGASITSASSMHNFDIYVAMYKKYMISLESVPLTTNITAHFAGKDEFFIRGSSEKEIAFAWPKYFRDTEIDMGCALLFESEGLCKQ